jgi:hypothetical protein
MNHHDGASEFWRHRVKTIRFEALASKVITGSGVLLSCHREDDRGARAVCLVLIGPQPSSDLATSNIDLLSHLGQQLSSKLGYEVHVETTSTEVRKESMLP